MLTRTTETTVTFGHSFIIGDLDELLPAGTYVVETDEELLQGLSFQSYRRVRTVFHIPPTTGEGGMGRSFTINPDDLEAALQRDAPGTSKAPGAPQDEPSRRKPGKSLSAEERYERTARERAQSEGMEFTKPPQ